MADSDHETEDKKNDSRRGWDELIFGTIEKLASTPGKLKDPGVAFEWMKGIREDVQEKIREEISQRIGKLDWNILAKKVGDHLADKYRLKVNATIEWEPKENLQDISIKTEKKNKDEEDSL